MKRIVLDCKGRLANQMLCWANARHVLLSLGLNDRVIVINYPIPSDQIYFPGAVIEQVKTESLTTVTRNDLALTDKDCLWVWSDLYSNFPANLNDTIRTIKLSDDFTKSLNNTVGFKSFIGIHARYGDYINIDPNNPPAAMPPFIRGSNAYFLKAIDFCCQESEDAKFYLASDGSAMELEFITTKSGVLRGKIDEPLFDLFAISRCKFIIGSGSTFSSVAAAFGEIPLIIPNTSDAEMQTIVRNHK